MGYKAAPDAGLKRSPVSSKIWAAQPLHTTRDFTWYPSPLGGLQYQTNAKNGPTS